MFNGIIHKFDEAVKKELVDTLDWLIGEIVEALEKVDKNIVSDPELEAIGTALHNDAKALKVKILELETKVKIDPTPSQPTAEGSPSATSSTGS